MAHGRVCPWWVGYFLASPVRRLLQDPSKILEPYVLPGMTVLEPGPGMGFFTLEIARRVGPAGRVIAVDIQPKMLSVLRRHSVAAGLQDRVETRLVQPDSIGARDLAGKVDFALVFAVVHEMPDAARFFRELGAALKIGGTVLLAEPAGHVKAARFDQELAAATEAGLATVDRPELRRAHTAVLRKE